MKITGKCVNDMEAKYSVIAKCKDGDVHIAVNGCYCYDFDAVLEIVNDHKNTEVELEIKQVELTEENWADFEDINALYLSLEATEDTIKGCLEELGRDDSLLNKFEDMFIKIRQTMGNSVAFDFKFLADDLMNVVKEYYERN